MPMGPGNSMHGSENEYISGNKIEDPTFRAPSNMIPTPAPPVPQNRYWISPQPTNITMPLALSDRQLLTLCLIVSMDPSALEEESLAIVSIYGPSSFYALPSNIKATGEPSLPVYTLKVSLEEPDFDYDPTTHTDNNNNNTEGGGPHITSNRKELELRVYFPEGYPETNTSPVHEIVSIYYGTLRLTGAMIQEIDQGLEECFVPGEVVVFAWIEWLRSYLEQLETLDTGGAISDDGEEEEEDEEDDEEVGDEGVKELSDYFQGDSHDSSTLLSTLSLSPSSTSNSPKLSVAPSVFKIQTGAPIVDRKSVFVAHLAPITHAGQVPWMIQQLKQENKKVVKATHNIMAFRVENETGTIAQDNDDDGETAAGSRLLHLMSILDVRNVVVVVSRWYGGIPLSADRFKHINNAARILLDECGYIKPTGISEASGTIKKKGNKKSLKK
ncbi:hypothetical protein BGZ92_006272 [Podila epicladia]|nr:hypothetical protein BGZ92_006272 [Podila epicladia]